MKRFALLGVSLAAFGALMVAGAFAQDPFTTSGTLGGTVSGGGEVPSTCDPSSLFVQLDQTTDQIASDGNYYPVADVWVGEDDPNCDYELQSLTVTDNGTATQNCPDAADEPIAGIQSVLPWDFALDPADAPAMFPPSTDGDISTIDPALAVTGSLATPQDSEVDLPLAIQDTGDCTIDVTGAVVEGTFAETESGAPVTTETSEEDETSEDDGVSSR